MQEKMAASFSFQQFSCGFVTIFCHVSFAWQMFLFRGEISKAVRIFVSTTYRVYAGSILPGSLRMRFLALLLCLPLLQPFVVVPRPLPPKNKHSLFGTKMIALFLGCNGVLHVLQNKWNCCVTWVGSSP